jgi:NTP pyrophosphatase (non-canonical NTP hydrolase)
MIEIGELASYLMRGEDQVYNYFDRDWDLFHFIHNISNLLKIDMLEAIKAKMIINDKKYPIKLCHGNLSKYTSYSHATNITETSGQEIMILSNNKVLLKTERNNMNKYWYACDGIAYAAFEFSKIRGWEEHETLSNLFFALSAETAELFQIFQWKDRNSDFVTISNDEWDKAAQEIADIIIYWMKFCNTPCSHKKNKGNI